MHGYKWPINCTRTRIRTYQPTETSVPATCPYYATMDNKVPPRLPSRTFKSPPRTRHGRSPVPNNLSRKWRSRGGNSGGTTQHGQLCVDRRTSFGMTSFSFLRSSFESLFVHTTTPTRSSSGLISSAVTANGSNRHTGMIQYDSTDWLPLQIDTEVTGRSVERVDAPQWGAWCRVWFTGEGGEGGERVTDHRCTCAAAIPAERAPCRFP